MVLFRYSFHIYDTQSLCQSLFGTAPPLKSKEAYATFTLLTNRVQHSGSGSKIPLIYSIGEFILYNNLQTIKNRPGVSYDAVNGVCFC